MYQIKVTPYPKYHTQTFLVVLPQRQFHSVGEKFIFVDNISESFICIKHCVRKETIKFSQLTDLHAYLDKNTDIDIYRTILKDNFRIEDDQDLDLMVFTDRSNIRLLNMANIKDYEVTQTLLSKKQINDKAIPGKPEIEDRKRQITLL